MSLQRWRKLRRAVNDMFAVIRIRGGVNDAKKLRNRMKMLGITRKNSLALVDESHKSAIIKIGACVAWGEISEDMAKKLRSKEDGNVFHLGPPRGGFRSVRHSYPKGDLGYHGRDINKLIERML